MSPNLATAAIALFVAWLFIRDSRLRPMTSHASWLPLIWLAIVGSRPVSTWSSGGTNYAGAEDYLEGSPMDAGIFLALIAVGLIVLQFRRIDWGKALSSNRWLFAFFFYCFISLVWSDFPFVSLKRWIKDFGNVVMVLIVLTEKDPTAAIRAIFARCTYLAIPLSILFIKYYPDLGRYYHQFTWTPGYSGVATEKNSLGVLALVCGLFLVWDLLQRKSVDREEEAAATAPQSASRGPIQSPQDGTRWPNSRPINTEPLPNSNLFARGHDRVDLMLRAVLIGMVFWVNSMANSSNALICLVLGTLVMLTLARSAKRGGAFIMKIGRYTILLAIFCFVLFIIPGLKEMILEALGEDATLTGRTDIWVDVLEEPNNVLVGSGYQSFWLGPVIARLWVKYPFHPNQAHNGYIETYLNGGMIGLGFLIAMLISGAASLKSRLLAQDHSSFLLASFFFVSVIYCWSEAMFNKMSPIWVILLLALVNYRPARQVATRSFNAPKLKRT